MKTIVIDADEFQELWDGFRVVYFLPADPDIKPNTVLIFKERPVSGRSSAKRELHTTVQYLKAITGLDDAVWFVLQVKVYKKTSPEIVEMRAKEA